MVTIHTSTLERQQSLPHFYYTTGSDGTGKSTQADLMIDYLETLGLKPQRLWLRFAFLTSTPLMVYARFRGFSWHEQESGISQGYWDFSQSWLLRNLLPWLMLLDAAIVSLFRVYIPLWRGQTIVCERFVLDMIADLELALNDSTFHAKLPGRLFFKLLPKNATIVLLDGETVVLQSRRVDLMFDRCLPDRLAVYRRLAKTFSLPMVSSSLTIPEVFKLIQSYIEGGTLYNTYDETL